MQDSQLHMSRYCLLAPPPFQKLAGPNFPAEGCEALFPSLQRNLPAARAPALPESAVALGIPFLVPAHAYMLMELCGVSRDFIPLL